MIVIVVAAVIFIGPDKLPELARTVGKLARELRSATDDFTRAKDDFTREFSRARDDVAKGVDARRLLEDGDASDDSTPRAPRRKPVAAESRDAAAIAAIREQKQKAATIDKEQGSSEASDAEAPNASAMAGRVDLSSRALHPEPARADEASPKQPTASTDESTADPAIAEARADEADERDPSGDDSLRARLQRAAEQRERREAQGVEHTLPSVRPAANALAVGDGWEDDAKPGADALDASPSEAAISASGDDRDPGEPPAPERMDEESASVAPSPADTDENSRGTL